MKELFPLPTGNIRIRYLNPDNEIIREDFMDNLVVNNARIIMRDQLYSGYSGNSLTTLQLGNSNLTYPDDPSVLSPPALTDTILVNPIYNTIAYRRATTIIDGKQALFMEFSIPAGSANDPDITKPFNLITELGLFTSSSRMFSRVVTPIIKSRDTALDIMWNILI